MSIALDTPYNALFGLFVTFWATLFVESWKSKQKVIQYLWSCEENTNNKVDERVEQFKYFNFYNPEVNRVQKVRRTMPTKLERFYNIAGFFILVAIVTMMSFHQYLLGLYKVKIDENGEVINELSEE